MKMRRSVAKDERAFVKAALGTRKNARVQRVAVNPGYGPGHAENALEGSLVDPAKIPKFQHGEEDVVSGPGRKVQMQLELERLQKLLAGGGAQSAQYRQLLDKYGLTVPEEQLYPDFINPPQAEKDTAQELLAAKGKRSVKAVQGDTDSVPAMLTPREAVLNRNAAELAGRGNIEQLNRQGNKLAVQGIDLPSGGKKMKKATKMQGGGYVPRVLPWSKKGGPNIGTPPATLGEPPGAYGRSGGGGTNTSTYGGNTVSPAPASKPRSNVPSGYGEPPGAYGRGGKKPPNISSPGVKAPFVAPPLPRGWNAWQGLLGGGVSNQPTPWRDPGPVGGGVPGPIGGPLGLGGGGFTNWMGGGYGGGNKGYGGGGGVTNWMGGYGGGYGGGGWTPPGYNIPGLYGNGGVTNWMGGGSGSFYPPQAGGNVAGGNQNLNKPYPGFQSGVSDLGGPGIGQNFGAPPQLQSGDIGNLIAALTKAGQQQGMSPQQIQGLLSAVQGMGGGGGGQLYGSGGGAISGLTASGGFQGGISDIGYPPMVGPNMDYHADKGSTWVGPYDPAYMINRQP